MESVNCNLQSREVVKEEKNYTILKELRERENGRQNIKNFQSMSSGGTVQPEMKVGSEGESVS